MSFIRDNSTSPPRATEHTTVIFVDENGVPSSIGGGPGGGLTAGQTRDAVRDGINLSRAGFVIATATTAGTGYAIGERVLFFFGATGVLGGFNVNTGTTLATNPVVADFNFATGGTTTASGGGIAVLYDIVGGATGLEGAWDIANARIFPDTGATSIAIGTATNQATNIRFPAVTSSDPSTPTIRFATFISELTPQTFNLTNCKMFAIVNQTLQTLRYAFVAGNTINNPNHSLISSAQPEWAVDKISVTGLLEICAETVPTPVTINNCITTSGSSTVTGTALSNIYVGQAVTGTGIPANTYIGSLNTSRTQLTLCSETGAAVNATANGSVSLTFSGAVIRLTTWS